MERHEDNKTKITKEFTANERLKKVYKTILWPTIDKEIEDIYLEVRDGDRLDNLAYQYYKDVSLWWVIAQANHMGKGSMYVIPGRKIRIPHPERIEDILDELLTMMENRW